MGNEEKTIDQDIGEIDQLRQTNDSIDELDFQSLREQLRQEIENRKRATEELAEEKNKLQSFFAAMQSLGTILDLDYTITYQNASVTKLFGDRTGQKCYRVFLGRDDVCEDCPVELAYKDGQSHTSTRTVVSPSGETTYWENTASPIRDASGKIVSCLEINRNITERKQAENKIKESQNFLQNVIDGILDEVIVINPDYSISLTNQATRKGRGSAPVSNGMKCYQMLHQSDSPCEGPGCLCPLREVLKTGETATAIHAYFDANDNENFMEISAAPIFNDSGEIIHIVESCRDITEHTRTEHQLEIAKEHAEAANIAKSQFLATMSHEIRTPMSVITGFSDMLLADELTNEQMMYAEHIQSAGKSLLNIINDILDFSRVEAGKLEIVPKDYLLKKILDGVDSMMRPLADKKDLEFKVICAEGLPAVILTDEGRLHQCLINLVSNAIKFTHEGYVHLNVYVEEMDTNAFVHFDVEDTGIGVPHDKQGHIFESFAQAEKGTTRKYGGTGLGLAITNHLTGLLGGEVSLISTEGKGSTFSMVIPVGLEILPEPSIEKKQPIHEIMSAKKRGHIYSGKVLVAEDDEGCQILEVTLLERLGLKVTAANDGKEAVEKALAECFDLIFMDVRMPNMNGFEAMETLHQKGITTPIVALTAHAMEGYSEICIQAGYDDYLSKPIEREKLLEILKKYLPAKAVTGS